MGSGTIFLVKRLKITLRHLWWRILRRAQEMVPKYVDARSVRLMRDTVSDLSTAHSIRRLFVDVSIIARKDAGTGIQRVVRAISMQLLMDSSTDWEVHFVAASRQDAYREIRWPHFQSMKDLEGAIPGQPGDVFLGLDFALDTIVRHQRQLLAWKSNGVALWFVMYDLLPVQHPGWFSDQLVVRFRRWFRLLAGMADGFFCISYTVEQDLHRYLEDRYNLEAGVKYQTGILPMSGDLSETQPSVGFPPGFSKLLEQLQGRRVGLMVGTLEPRKGHEDILNAFETLWATGSSDCLVIVGRSGWKTERLQRRLVGNTKAGVNLFWLSDASDEALNKLYDICSGVIVASYGEGFGLPIVEAIDHGKPVLARDIPVFRAHAVEGIHFFSETRAFPLAKVIDCWLEETKFDSSPLTTPVNWSESCAAIKFHLNRKI